MPWSDWYPLTRNGINNNVPDDIGAYRIALKDGKVFSIEEDDDVEIWVGIVNADRNLEKCIRNNEPMRVCLCNSTFCTDLVYIGQSTEQTIKQRLLQHLGGQGNKCLKLILDYEIPLYFSYLTHYEPEDFEEKLFKRFVKETEGVCPPCDCGSNECSRAYGKYLPTFLMIHKNKVKLLC